MGSHCEVTGTSVTDVMGNQGGSLIFAGNVTRHDKIELRLGGYGNGGDRPERPVATDDRAEEGFLCPFGFLGSGRRSPKALNSLGLRQARARQGDRSFFLSPADLAQLGPELQPVELLAGISGRRLPLRTAGLTQLEGKVK